MNEKVVSEPDGLTIDVIEYRPPGYGVTVGGALVAVTGAALLGLAFRDRKSTRAGSDARVSAAPVLTPQSYGVAIAGHF